MSLARTRIAVRLIAVAALAALTAGCFQQMYAERTDGKPGLREKVEIRNALAFKLYGNATGMPPTHRLVLRFTTTRNSLMIDPNTAPVRALSRSRVATSAPAAGPVRRAASPPVHHRRC